jgi:hypothetical protein
MGKAFLCSLIRFVLSLCSVMQGTSIVRFNCSSKLVGITYSCIPPYLICMNFSSPSHIQEKGKVVDAHCDQTLHSMLLCLCIPLEAVVQIHHIVQHSTSFCCNQISLSVISHIIQKLSCVTSVKEPPQKWGVRLPRSKSADSQRNENACKHTNEAFKTIISLKIKLWHLVSRLQEWEAEGASKDRTCLRKRFTRRSRTFTPP